MLHGNNTVIIIWSWPIVHRWQSNSTKVCDKTDFVWAQTGAVLLSLMGTQVIYQAKNHVKWTDVLWLCNNFSKINIHKNTQFLRKVLLTHQVFAAQQLPDCLDWVDGEDRKKIQSPVQKWCLVFCFFKWYFQFFVTDSKSYGRLAILTHPITSRAMWWCAVERQKDSTVKLFSIFWPSNRGRDYKHSDASHSPCSIFYSPCSSYFLTSSHTTYLLSEFKSTFHFSKSREKFLFSFTTFGLYWHIPQWCAVVFFTCEKIYLVQQKNCCYWLENNPTLLIHPFQLACLLIYITVSAIQVLWWSLGGSSWGMWGVRLTRNVKATSLRLCIHLFDTHFG